MKSLPLVLLIISIVILSDYVQWSSCTCTYCRGAECNIPPSRHCPFGEYRNRCMRRDCLQGPGDRCGGPIRNSFGDCAEGLYCSTENRCTGCYLPSMDCYPKSIKKLYPY